MQVCGHLPTLCWWQWPCLTLWPAYRRYPAICIPWHGWTLPAIGTCQAAYGQKAVAELTERLTIFRWLYWAHVLVPGYLYFYTWGAYEDWVPYHWCFLYFCLGEHLPTIFHTASVWLTVALGVQRYIKFDSRFSLNQSWAWVHFCWPNPIPSMKSWTQSTPIESGYS